MGKLIFVTATWARTPEERDRILETMRALNSLGIEIVIGNKTKTHFPLSKELSKLSMVHIIEAESFNAQRTLSFKEAASMAENIFWLESDKKEFVINHLSNILSSLALDTPQVVFPSPTRASFDKYPQFQILIENCINQLISASGAPALHYTYGPMLFPSKLALYLPTDTEFGWGINAFLALVAKQKNVPVSNFEIEAEHDADVQMGETLTLFRLEQLKEYIIAIEEALKLTQNIKQ